MFKYKLTNLKYSSSSRLNESARSFPRTFTVTSNEMLTEGQVVRRAWRVLKEETGLDLVGATTVDPDAPSDEVNELVEKMQKAAKNASVIYADGNRQLGGFNEVHIEEEPEGKTLYVTCERVGVVCVYNIEDAVKIAVYDEESGSIELPACTICVGRGMMHRGSLKVQRMLLDSTEDDIYYPSR